MKKKNIQTPVLLMAIAACMISHQQNAWGREKPSLQNDSVPYVTMPDVSPELTTGDGNPLLHFMFTADPTAVEYNGRIYVYATNDQQQYDSIGGYGKNSYEYIKSLVMMSSDDMTNWTYHGILTSTSPIGPWSSPLNHSLVDTNTPGIAGECKAAFDPGVVIDDKGKGWLTVGGGCARIMRLGKDMISVDGPIKPIRAPHHFEANELNYINGTYVYTYNIDWQDFSDWPLPTERPTTCCMSYMTSKTPLVTKSWKYQHNYMKNPGDYGFDYSNNHTHLHKFRGKWYVFYHTMSLQHSFNTTAGFRNVCVDEIRVDENTVNIHMGNQTLKGVKQIQPMNPFIIQQAETTAATQGVKFTNGKSIGDMYAVTVPNKTGIIAVRGVEFNKVPSSLEIKASGNGIIEVRRDRPDGEVIASIKVGTPQMKLIESQLQKNMTGTMDLCFVLKGNNITFDEWKFK